MASEDLIQWLAQEPLIITEFGVNERLRHHPRLEEDPHVGNARLLLSAEGRQALAGIYLEYLSIAAEASLPMIIQAPTWRVNRVRCKRAGLDVDDMNRRAVGFVRDLANKTPGSRVVVAGLMAPAGDAYKPEDALLEDEAFAFHQEQASALAQAGADFLMPATLPELGEAKGLARACATSGLAYVPCFVLDNRGRLLDGTSLPEAMQAVDACVGKPPACHMICCTHPKKASLALAEHGPMPRLAGLQANASELTPEELERLGHTDQGDPDDFAARLAGLHLDHGMKVLGGCCGTDSRHMRAFVRALGRG